MPSDELSFQEIWDSKPQEEKNKVQKILKDFFARIDAQNAELANRNRRKSDHKKSHKRGSRGHAKR